MLFSQLNNIWYNYFVCIISIRDTNPEGSKTGLLNRKKGSSKGIFQYSIIWFINVCPHENAAE
jgi:hypothetical protein